MLLTCSLFLLGECEIRSQYIYMRQDLLTPGVSHKTYTKSQPFNIIYQMAHITPTIKLK